MKIDRKMNLTFPLQREDGASIHVVAQAISAQVYKTYYLIIAKAWTKMYEERLHLYGGPAVARDVLEDVAKQTSRGDFEGSWWEGPGGVETGLLGEIRRLAVVLVPNPDGAGFQTIQFEEAIGKNLFTEDEVTEVEGAIVFFILNWRMLRSVVREAIINAAGSLWGWRITSSTVSEYRNSLQTSTTDETTTKPEPETAKAQSSRIR
jgi:hypothetical protein